MYDFIHIKTALPGQPLCIYTAVRCYFTVLFAYAQQATLVLQQQPSHCLQPSFLSHLEASSDRTVATPMKMQNTGLHEAMGLHLPQAASRDSISWITLEVFSKASRTYPSLISSSSLSFSVFLTVRPDGLVFAADVPSRTLLLSNKTRVILLRKEKKNSESSS